MYPLTRRILEYRLKKETGLKLAVEDYRQDDRLDGDTMHDPVRRSEQYLLMARMDRDSVLEEYLKDPVAPVTPYMNDGMITMGGSLVSVRYPSEQDIVRFVFVPNQDGDVISRLISEDYERYFGDIVISSEGTPIARLLLGARIDAATHHEFSIGGQTVRVVSVENTDLFTRVSQEGDVDETAHVL